jgi:hypothetical protein
MIRDAGLVSLLLMGVNVGLLSGTCKCFFFAYAEMSQNIDRDYFDASVGRSYTRCRLVNLGCTASSKWQISA